MAALQNMRQGLVRALEVLVMSMVALLTLTVLWGVFTRFVIGHQAQYTDELARLRARFGRALLRIEIHAPDAAPDSCGVSVLSERA